MRTLVIIPAYNEDKNLPTLLDRIILSCPSYDILVINDCSTDNTSEICNIKNINVVNLPVNLGIGGAVQTGYKYAFYNNYDAAVQLDGDGQHDPSYIPLLISELTKGADLCIGSRFINKKGFQSSAFRRIGIRYLSGLIFLFTGRHVTDPTSGYRACGKKVIELFSQDYPKDYPEPETFVNVCVRKLKTVEIPVIMNKREKGRSSITNIKSVYYIVKVSLAIIIASFSKTKSKENK